MPGVQKTLKNGALALDPRLDRIAQFDERSRGFAAVDLIPPAAPLRSRLWDLRWRLDQGQEGACTNFGLAHNRLGSPRPRVLVPRVGTHAEQVVGVQRLAHDLYIRSQQLDEWPGQEPAYSGTSLLAACKAWREKGLLGEYRWGFGIDDVLAVLANLGPVVFATDWLQGMFEPDWDGLLRVEGAPAGGHAYAMIGLVLRPDRSQAWAGTGERNPLLIGCNSWGEGWGHGGLFAMRASDADRLLKQAGEACVPLDRTPAK